MGKHLDLGYWGGTATRRGIILIWGERKRVGEAVRPIPGGDLVFSMFEIKGALPPLPFWEGDI